MPGPVRWNRIAWCVLLAGLLTYVQAQFDLDVGPPIPPIIAEMISAAFAVVIACPESIELEEYEQICAHFDSTWGTDTTRSLIDLGLEAPFFRDVVPAIRGGDTAELMKSRPMMIQPWTAGENAFTKVVGVGNTRIVIALYHATHKGRGLLLFLWQEAGQ